MAGLIPRRGSAQLIRANERVLCATRYALGNILYVLTGETVVVIDTTGGMSSASASFKEFRKICPLPVSYIIYTHFHSDHIRGAKVFHMPGTQVIAQGALPAELASMNEVRSYRKRIVALQFGLDLKSNGQAVTVLDEADNGYLPPDILFGEEYRFQEGDLTFELYHTQGESLDHVMIWIPEIRTLFPGDLYYRSFPMLSNPMKPPRPVLAWAESLDRMRALSPAHLVPSHGKPLSGTTKIDTVLANYARAIRHVHDETVKQINQGSSLDETVDRVALPPELARLPYLQERYGTLAWSVTGIFMQYTGWYSANPVDLNPAPRPVLYQALLDASGGPTPLLDRAARALSEGHNQLALELSDIVLATRPENWRAHRISQEALRFLTGESENGVARNIYRHAAKETSRNLRILSDQQQRIVP
jgi:alkyl sulfatase BDS1-like metallo-beta-lactamase superfamily hydrolase